jgi:hypothetical protein
MTRTSQRDYPGGIRVQRYERRAPHEVASASSLLGPDTAADRTGDAAVTGVSSASTDVVCSHRAGGTTIAAMPNVAMIVVGVIVLALVTFANPIEGSVLGFCPISEGPKAVGIDVVVAAIDASALWLIYRGVLA